MLAAFGLHEAETRATRELKQELHLSDGVGITVSRDRYIYRPPALAFVYSDQDAFPLLSVFILLRLIDA